MLDLKEVFRRDSVAITGGSIHFGSSTANIHTPSGADPSLTINLANPDGSGEGESNHHKINLTSASGTLTLTLDPGGSSGGQLWFKQHASLAVDVNFTGYGDTSVVWFGAEADLSALAVGKRLIVSWAYDPDDDAIGLTVAAAESTTFEAPVATSSVLITSIVPGHIYAVEGQESNVYFDNAIYTTPREAWEYDITCAKGIQYANRWSYTPVAGDVATGTTAEISWTCSPKVNAWESDDLTATLRISKLTAGTGESRNVLLIGDSTGAGPLNELMNLVDGDAMTITLVGQHKLTANDADSGSRIANHEAIGGWTWGYFSTQQLTESGDASSQLSGWNLSGHTSANTSNGILYWGIDRPTGNQLDNEGFETLGEGGADVFASWTEDGATGTIAADGGVKRTGSYSCKLTRGTSANTPNLFQLVSVTPGQSWTVSGWAQQAAGAYPRYAIWDNTQGAYIKALTWVGGVGEFTEFTHTFTVPAGCYEIRVWLLPPQTSEGDAGYIDDMSLVLNTADAVRVSLYTSSDGSGLVARGERFGNGEVTLVAQNSSGLSGTVTAVYSTDDAVSSANTLTLNFLVRDADVGFDFDQYLTDTSTTMTSGDWVLIHLGINDVFAATTDAAVQTILDGLAATIDTMVGTGDSPADTTIVGAVSGIRVGICVPIPPSSSQDAFGDDYSSGQSRWRYRQNNVLLQAWVIANYDTTAMRAKGIHVLPYHVNLDTVNNMATTLTTYNARHDGTYYMQTNGIHPMAYGYWQMADSLFAFIKYHE